DGQGLAGAGPALRGQGVAQGGRHVRAQVPLAIHTGAMASDNAELVRRPFAYCEPVDWAPALAARRATRAPTTTSTTPTTSSRTWCQPKPPLPIPSGSASTATNTAIAPTTTNVQPT